MNIQKIINQIAPLQSQRRRLIKRILIKNKTNQETRNVKNIEYSEWISKCEPIVFKDTDSKLIIAKYNPLISIIVPCFNTPKKYIDPLIKSVKAQHYENWELCLADGSSDNQTVDYIKKCAQEDRRIKYLKVGKNLGIVGNTNIGISGSKGEFIAFLDHDDMLSPYALAEVIIKLNENKKIDLIYSDEDKLTDDGKTRLNPFFKPDWSPELLLGVNYITHFVVVRKSMVDMIGGLRMGFDGAQDYDFLLRLTEKTDKIAHIPKILYHWRLADGSTAKNVGEKNYADTAGRRALRDAARRRGVQADVIEIPERPTNYRLKYLLPKKQLKVSVIIPFKDKVELLIKCVESIRQKSTYTNYELILVSNNSTEKETHNFLEQLKKDKVCKVFYWDYPFNYSKVNNFGRSKATGEYLVLLNNDTEIISPDWLEELIGVASQDNIGEVGALLYYPNKTIQHAGIVLGLDTMAGHVFRHRVPGDWTDYGMPAWPRNYLAVTAACVAIKASRYDEVGGLDEKFTVAGNDVALGISLYEKGYRNVYWPFAELIHYESVSVGSYNNIPRMDYNHSLSYYRPYLKWNDPYFNSNLDLMNEQIGLRSTYE